MVSGFFYISLARGFMVSYSRYCFFKLWNRDNLFTIYSIALEIFVSFRKGIIRMKKNKGFKNTILLSIAVMFVAASNMIATSGSLY